MQLVADLGGAKQNRLELWSPPTNSHSASNALIILDQGVLRKPQKWILARSCRQHHGTTNTDLTAASLQIYKHHNSYRSNKYRSNSPSEVH
jgi:hypothetical protein